MATVPTVAIVGVSDDLGYIHCASCVDVCSYDRGFIYHDSAPHNADRCDDCGRVLVPQRRVTELRQGDKVIAGRSVWKITNEPYVFYGYVQCDLDDGYGRKGRYAFRSDTSIGVV